MAKGASNEEVLGRVHSMLAKVFTRSLERQLKIYEALDKIPEGEVEADMLELIAEMQEPNPAMLSAIAKFLKDNDIGMAVEQVEELNSTERRLAEKRQARKAAGLRLVSVPVVDEQ